ncbi:MAG: hypothetical protein ACM34A_01690 [Bacillota bacterium]
MGDAVKRFLCAFVLKKSLLFVLMLAMLVHQQISYSQALPVAPAANFVMNRAVAGVITRVAAARGFAANDARIAATLTGASASLTAVNTASTVAGVALTVAGAPMWLTVAAGLGVLAVGAAIVAGTTSLSIESTSTGNKLQVSSSPTITPTPYTPPPAPADPFAYLVNNGQEVYRDVSCFQSQACFQFPALPPGDIPIQWRPASSPDYGSVVVVYWSLDAFKNKWTPWGYPPGVLFDGHWYTPANLSTAQWVSGPTWDLSQSSKRLIGSLRLDFQDSSVAPSIISQFSSDQNPLTISPNFGPSQYSSLDEAYPRLSPSVTGQKLSNASLARIVDQAWQRAAAQPGYQGLPYSVSQPVTEFDVQPWAMENPMAVPTIGDFLTPANDPGTNTVPISPTVQPGTSTTTPTDPTSPTTGGNVNVVNTPNVNVVNKINVDLGTDPGIGTPGLESTPTASMILQPLFDLFPSLRNFVVPSHGSECPKPTFELFGKNIIMDSHCTLTESVRPTLYAVMAAVWLLIGLFIVLAA